ncbi:GNAT family N-acetyltransferase [Aerophototrophica crusticola]|uniref:GNAT family N-acetyltransferase n=1 Tax=Aerophototrophica crusticola TaxID=1709002 RepID=A0A858R8T9_9PROT|nr:GNAT family N-acetyltransferase [Rhodospirillaceae bacterium B3]
MGGLTPPAPLRPDHDVSAFACGQPALDDWLRHRAIKNESRFSRTYVVCDGGRVVAYYCLAAGAVDRSAAPGRLRRNAPDSVPVSVLGRLAVDRGHAGRGLGKDLLADAFRRVVGAADAIGIAALLVQAKDDGAKRFYLSCAEFIEYPADSRILFLPIETVMAALQAR